MSDNNHSDNGAQAVLLRAAMTRLSILFLGLVVGCGSGGVTNPGGDYSGSNGPDGGSNGGSDGSGSGGSGSDGSGGGSGSGSSYTDNTPPTYPTQHPRIYIAATKARLQAALAANRPSATRFKGIVDNWVNGTDYWGFGTWNAALMGQLTGQAKYCTKAIATVDAQVSAAEAAIGAGQPPAVAGDSYLDVGEMIGDVALVYDWCFDSVSASQ